MITTNRFKFYVIVSLALHLMLVLSFQFLNSKLTSIKKDQVEITFVDQKNETLNPPQAQQQPIDKLKKQIVETDENQANLQKNTKAHYLSAKDHTVDRETIAKLAQQFKNTDKNKPVEKARPLSKKEKSHETIKADQKLLENDLFGQKFNAYSSLEKQQDRQQNLNDSELNNLQNKNGEESTATDRVDGVQNSLKTALNTREYKYYGYYQRIKTQLNQFWQPQVREKVTRLMTQGRTIASDSNNKITKLIIVLNDTGTLVKVQVLSESGVRDLDDAAVEAFRQAAPFPNPPRGMIESDGTIKIRWDFVVES